MDTPAGPCDPRARRLRTAIVRTGFVGPFHVDAVRRTGYADVVALVGSGRRRRAG